MGKTLFYRCGGCGNFVMFLGDKTACTPRCCGEPMTQLVPNTTDAATEKHVPVVTVEGNKVSVQVGSVIHPMTEKHYIQFTCLETEKGVQVRYLTPDDEPKAEFLVAEGDKTVSVYEYCNLHGLWEKSLAEPEKQPTKILVAYFSTGHVTEDAAEKIAKAAEADLFEIKPQVPYTDADLDWTDRSARSNHEMHDEASRPEVTGKVECPDQYDTVFVGFPIWWGITPKIVYTFLDSMDLAGKTIVPFCTSGGTKTGAVDKDLAKNIKGAAKILPAALLNGKPSEEEVEKWFKGLDI